MDSIGGTNPSEPNTNDQATSNEVGPGTVVPPTHAADPKPAMVSDFHFEDTASTPIAQPPVGGAHEAPAPHLPSTPEKPETKPAKAKNPGTGKKALLWLLVILLVLGAGAGGFVYGMKVGKDKTLAEVQKEKDAATTKAAKTPIADVEDTTDENDLAVGDLKTPTYADESLTGKVNQQMDANDGLIMKVTSVERDYQSKDPNYKVETGKELIVVNLLLGNQTKDQAKDITPSNFKLLNSAGAPKTNEVLTGYPNKFDSVKIEPGKVVKVSIVYKVEEDEKPLNLVREQQYRIATGNKTVTTKITINLDSTTDS